MVKKTNQILSATSDSSFRPILIDNLETKLLKEDERGKMYLLRNPNNSKYIKMHESVWGILKTLDGSKSIGDLSQAIKDANVQVDACELVKLLAEEGFVANIEAHKGKDRGDIFSFKIKLLTMTEKRLAFLEKVFLPVRSRIFQIFYAAFLAVSFSLFIYSLPQIFSTVVDFLSPDTALLPLFYSTIFFYLVEFAHEFAHAVSYYHYGGKSSEIGIEFHFLIPFFYTSTPDATWMKTRKQIIIFLAGPMVSLFFAGVFTFLFVFEPTLRYLWASHAFFWHISTLITLSPIMRTDGYFMVQAATKFPNLLEHGVDTLAKAFQVLIRKVSIKELKEHWSQYSANERKILKIYLPFFPIVASALVFVFVFMGLQLGMFQVLNMTPQILAGAAQGVKPYVLWVSYVASLVFSLVGIVGTLVNVFKKVREM